MGAYVIHLRLSYSQNCFSCVLQILMYCISTFQSLLMFVVLGSGCFCCNKDFKKWSYLGVTGSPSVKYNFDTLMLTISSINSQSMSNTSWCLLYVPYIIFLSQWVLNKCLVNVQNWVFTVGRRMHALKWSVCSLSIQGCLGQLPELRWDILR